MKSKIIQTAIFFVGCIGILNLCLGWMNKNQIPENIIRQAINKSVPVLQKSTNTFIVKGRCSSCHHGSMTSMVVSLAKQKGFSLEDSFAIRRQQAVEGTLRYICNPNCVRDFLNVKLIIPYQLMGYAAEKIAPDFNTDLAVAFLISEANSDGSFPGEYLRAPMEVGEIHTTVTTIRAIQLYASPSLKPVTDRMITKTRTWLESRNPTCQQELTFQLMGMSWCGSAEEKKKEVAVKLLNMQRPDGGWAQIPSLNSDAYATGQALYALYESGMIQTADEPCQKAINYLLKTQDRYGSWFVEARSYIIQPFLNSDFPVNDENQFISAAATSWASLALLKSLPDKIN